jgi:hypothetical protein
MPANPAGKAGLGKNASFWFLKGRLHRGGMAVPGREKVAIHIGGGGTASVSSGGKGSHLTQGRAARAREAPVGGVLVREEGGTYRSAKDEERVVMAPGVPILRLQLSRHRPRYCPDLYFPPWTCLPFRPVAPRVTVGGGPPFHL